MKDKLTELMWEAPFGCRAFKQQYYKRIMVKLADYLLANGVIVQECGHWVSLTDCSNAGVYCSVCHKKVYKEDYAWCNRKNKLRSDYCPNCGAKMMPNH